MNLGRTAYYSKVNNLFQNFKTKYDMRIGWISLSLSGTKNPVQNRIAKRSIETKLGSKI
jgi:hypothetical protein